MRRVVPGGSGSSDDEVRPAIVAVGDLRADRHGSRGKQPAKPKRPPPRPTRREQGSGCLSVFSIRHLPLPLRQGTLRWAA